MKLHEALRNIFRNFGLEVLEDGRFQGFLADYRAYDEFPAMRQVMRSLADGGYGKELGSRIRNGNDADVRLYGDYLKKALSAALNFKTEFASYAVDSIFFAMGFTGSVQEPRDHGFDASAESAAWDMWSYGCSQSGLSSGGRTDGSAPEKQRCGSRDPAGILREAEEGNADAQIKAGDLYCFGYCSPRDFDEAAKWYRKAAVQGDVSGEMRLASLYESGFGAERDLTLAAKWYRKAAEQGDTGAEYKRAQMYESGTGVSEAPAEAAKWYRKAAEQGSAAAQRALGSMYCSGAGVPEDWAEAMKWLRLASINGDSAASDLLDCLVMHYKTNARVRWVIS